MSAKKDYSYVFCSYKRELQVNTKASLIAYCLSICGEYIFCFMLSSRINESNISFRLASSCLSLILSGLHVLLRIRQPIQAQNQNNIFKLFFILSNIIGMQVFYLVFPVIACPVMCVKSETLTYYSTLFALFITEQSQVNKNGRGRGFVGTQHAASAIGMPHFFFNSSVNYS